LHEQVKAEMHQIVVEVGSNFCENVTEARKEVSFLRNKISGLAGNQSLLVVVDELKDIARLNLIFGLYVQVAIENRGIALQLMNQACYFLPHIYALTTNSPFWEG